MSLSLIKTLFSFSFSSLLSLIKLFLIKYSCNNFALYKILFKERYLYLVLILNLDGILLYKDINLLKIFISCLFNPYLNLHISIISSLL